MPDWFYPLMLVVILAGYVFLFLQARRYQVETSALRDEVDRRLRRIEERLELLPERLDRLERPREVAEDPPGLASLGERLDGVAGLIEALRELVEERTAREPEPQPAAAARPLPPQVVARRFLLEEGFAQARFGEVEEAEGRVRMAVTALRGDEFRSGHVVVEGDQVIDASLKVPTAFFP